MDADRATVADLIAESVAELTSAEVEWELRTRHPADWAPPAGDYTRRELLAEILTEERTRRLGQ